jgi:hypothetical protein
MDDTATTPEIKSTTISASKMMGREVGGGNTSGPQGKESNIGKLSRILRTTRIKVNDVETEIKDSDKRIKINAEKITRIKNIFKEQKSTLAENLSSLDQTAEFASVEKGLDAIIETLKKERKVEEKASEAARRKKEKNRAKSREKKLESGLGKGVNKVVGTVVKPFKSIFDKIFNFLLNVLIGRTIIKLIGWFSDKKNQDKIQSLIRFVKDWWPALTAAVLLFGTGFGALAGGLVALIAGFIPKFLALSIKLAAAIAKNPFAIGAGLFLAGAAVPALFPQTVEDSADKQANKAAEEKGNEQAAADIKEQNKDRNPLQQFGDFITGAGAEREEQAQRLETGKEKRYGFFGELNGGGRVPGRGPNKDTIPTMLTPGEFVMSRGAVDKFGSDTLESMNAMGGGTNIPKRSSGVTYASGGGMIGDYDHKEKSSSKHKQLMNERTSEAQAPGGIDKRHNQLMQSTSQEKIAAYDKKHGEGAYSKKLREKLTKIYVAPIQSSIKKSIVPTGQVVGRENLPASTVKVLERMDAQKGSGDKPTDTQYTKDGRKISADQFNKVQGMLGAAKEGGAEGVLKHMLSGAKSMFGGMFDKAQGAINDPKSFVESMGGTVKDGNIGKPTTQEQKDIDALATKKEKLKQSQQSLIGAKSPAKPSQGDASLRDEYDMIQNNPHHPLFEKVRGGGDIDDFGMRFSEFKKFKAQQIKPPQQSPAQMSHVQSRKPDIKPPVRPEPKVEFLPMPATGDSSAAPAAPTGRNNIPSFDVLTAGSNLVSELLGFMR